jgi:hypothetical protein
MRVDYDTPYVRNLPVMLTVRETSVAQVGVVRPWGDALWKNVRHFVPA